MHLQNCSPLVKAAIKLPRGQSDRETSEAWQAHLDARRIGAAPERVGTGEFGCEGLARALGMHHPGDGA